MRSTQKCGGLAKTCCHALGACGKMYIGGARRVVPGPRSGPSFAYVPQGVLEVRVRLAFVGPPPVLARPGALCLSPPWPAPAPPLCLGFPLAFRLGLSGAPCLALRALGLLPAPPLWSPGLGHCRDTTGAKPAASCERAAGLADPASTTASLRRAVMGGHPLRGAWASGHPQAGEPAPWPPAMERYDCRRHEPQAVCRSPDRVARRVGAPGPRAWGRPKRAKEGRGEGGG